MKILEILTEKRKIGNVGERAAEKLLKKSGYKILERNYVALGYEIDIIAHDREHTVFCEVKTRTMGRESSKEFRPASSVTPEKQKKIITVAKYYNANKNLSRKMRFDIIEVFVDDTKKVQDTKHLIGAFNYDTASKR
ncbi:MAG: YraN family protein [Oscillospiraceae bacterium]|nr:YraN family protein [Oscillospiraceae bacterium]